MKPVKAAMSKIMEITLLFIFCSTIFNLPDVSTARAQLLPQRECEKITNVTFLTFLPCLKEFGDSASTFEQLDSCDFLTRAAVELAAERVNRNWNVSGNSQRFLNLTPLHGVSDSVGTRDLPAEIRIQQVTDHTYRSMNNLSELFGIVGPNGPAAAEFWAPIFQHLHLLTVSYDATNLGLEESFTFYRTLPSDRGANMGRLALMVQFQWFRIATISSHEQYYAQVGESFISLLNNIAHRSQQSTVQLMAMSTTFSRRSPDSALSDIQQRDINIIFGFFGPEIARYVLCRAFSQNLISAEHAWILPSYYERNWWRENSLNDDDGCSDSTMQEILESIIFVNTIKIPPMELSLDSFNHLLADRMQKLFEVPSLTEEDLKPYLLRSRATSAYDAVTLLARSVGVAFDLGGDNCTDYRVIQTVLEKEFMECEYCRIHSGCSFNETERCQESCPAGPDFSTPGAEKLRKDANSDHLSNFFGQVLYTQFIGGEECPVAISWCFDEDNQPLNSNGVQECLYALDELDSAPCDARLRLSEFEFTRRENGCPLHFQWQGSGDAPSSHYIITIGFPVAELVVIGVVVGLGLMIAVAFLIFNIVWRQNKFVKASSPWINVILIMGIIIRMPVSLLSSLAVSTAKYGFNSSYIVPLCYFSFMSDGLGDVIFIAALIAKNWRIYRIFNNRKLEDIGKQLSDRWLALGILIAVLPIATTAVVMATFNVRLEMTTVQDEMTLHVYVVSHCFVDHEQRFRTAMGIYNLFLLFSLVILSFLTSFVKSETFRREAHLSLRATALTILPLPILTVAYTVLRFEGTVDVDHVQATVWIRVMLTVVFPVLIVIVLFVPNIYLMIKEHVTENRPKTRASEKSHQLSRHYHNLLRQSGTLKKQLDDYNRQITRLSLKQQMQQDKDCTNSAESSKVSKKTVTSTQYTVDENQLNKHCQEQDDEETDHEPTFSSMENLIEGSRVTLVTVVSDCLLAGHSDTEQKLVQINEEEGLSITAAGLLGDEGYREQCKLFTLPDT